MSNITDTLTALTADLMAFESIAERPDQLASVINYIETYVRAIPGVFVHRYERNEKPSLMVTLRDTHEPEIIYNAHLDVVAGRPDQFAAERRDGRIYGRGSQDMKGSTAVLLQLLRDLAALDERPDIGFQFVSDEEIGGYDGTGHQLELGWRCKFFLTAEPTDMQVCYAHKGVMRFDVTLRGVPAHGARPWEGSNAIHALRDGLAAIEARYPTPAAPAWVTTVVPTMVRAGESINRLPEVVTLMIDARYIPEETPEMVLAALQTCFPGGSVTLTPDWGVPLDSDPSDPFIARLAATSAALVPQSGALYREHFASDARFYSSAGIPSVCFGPFGAGLHSDTEWVLAAGLTQLYEVLRRFALND